MNTKIEHQYISVNGISIHVVLAGPKQGEPLLLLHGFPEAWFCWKEQIEPLANAGYRLIIPDQRGYNLSEKPRGIKNYKIDILIQDIICLLDHFAYQKVFLAAHDWGAIVGWFMGIYHADRIKKMVMMNVPHPLVMERNLLQNPRQMLRSWYTFIFQIPFFPEWFIRRKNGSTMASVLKKTGNENSFDPRLIAQYRSAWCKEGAAAGMVNWYRAAFWYRQEMPREKSKVCVPTKLIWGKRDVALRHQMTGPSMAFCLDGELEILPEASHWVQHDEPQKVNKSLIEWFT